MTHAVHVSWCFFFFFFQAEDGIRDLTVTGVQTCALPICGGLPRRAPAAGAARRGARRTWPGRRRDRRAAWHLELARPADRRTGSGPRPREIGRGAGRGRGENSGGAGSIKKKKKKKERDTR